MIEEDKNLFGDSIPDSATRTVVLSIIALVCHYLNYHILIQTCVTGIITLGLTFIVMRKVESYKTPFGILMQARCLHSILLLLIFLLWVVPSGEL